LKFSFKIVKVKQRNWLDGPNILGSSFFFTFLFVLRHNLLLSGFHFLNVFCFFFALTLNFNFIGFYFLSLYFFDFSLLFLLKFRLKVNFEGIFATEWLFSINLSENWNVSNIIEPSEQIDILFSISLSDNKSKLAI
jgi:hypothetical protein